MLKHTRNLGRLLLALPVGLLLGVVATPLLDATPTRAWSAPPPGCGDPTSTALAEYFDGTLPGRLTLDHVPGAAVSVVSGDRTVFAQGYGLADAEHGVPFSATDSLVRLASITKLFTWTAVMQQVEAGRLDLNADVNQYLTAFKVPATYPEPITLLTLMNHTSGFEYRIVDTAGRTAQDVPPLAEFLADHMPARIYPPGEVSAYSNYGAALAGYIVTQISGEPYDEYIQRHLLEPLGMTHSTATEPLPAALAADLARSYDSDAVPPAAIPFWFERMAPDGALNASATDMANFMVAELNAGRFENRSILTPATMSLMHERTFSVDPRQGGYAHGFQDKTINGHRVLMHDGAWEGFRSVLVLVSDCQLGFFITTNATGGVEAATAVMDGFFDRFTPAGPTVDNGPSTVGTTTTPGTAVAGFYKLARHNEATVEKLLVLLGPSRMTLDADGTVHFKGKAWTSEGDGHYRELDGTGRLTFLTGGDGRRYVVTDGPAYQLMPSSESLPVNLVVLLVFLVPALSALAVPLVALVRRFRRRSATTSTSWRVARWLGVGACMVGIVFLVGLALTLFGDTSEYMFEVPNSFILLLGLPIIVLVAALASIGLTVRAWRTATVGVAARIHHVVILVAMLPLAWFCWQWNLVGWYLG